MPNPTWTPERSEAAKALAKAHILKHGAFSGASELVKELLAAVSAMECERQEAAKWKRRCLMPVLGALIGQDRAAYVNNANGVACIIADTLKDATKKAPKVIAHSLLMEMWEDDLLSFKTGGYYTITDAGREAYKAMCAED